MPTLSEIAQLLDSPAPAEGANRAITGLATLAEAGPEDLTFVSAEQYVPQLNSTRAAAAVVQSRIKLPPEWESRCLRVENADLAVARVLELFAPPVPRPPPGIDASARVAKSAAIGGDVAIGPNAVIGERANIGRGTVLHAGVYIGDDVVIGDNCEFFAHVVIRERITLGNRVVIHAGSVLGTDGFGYRWDGSRHQKLPHIGTVVIEDDVEIGSCVCIDRAKFSATRIGQGTKIDNLVQVGHNVQIGANCIIAGLSGLGGSARLGTGVMLGGQAAIRDHIQLGDGAIAAACSGVAEDVGPKTIVSGTPAMPHRESLREQAALRGLPELRAQVRKLQEELEALKIQCDGSSPARGKSSTTP